MTTQFTTVSGKAPRAGETPGERTERIKQKIDYISDNITSCLRKMQEFQDVSSSRFLFTVRAILRQDKIGDS